MVADSAYVCSGAYHFAFDMRRKLGMVVPEWVEESDLPKPCRSAKANGGTTLYLQLNEAYQQDAGKRSVQGSWRVRESLELPFGVSIVPPTPGATATAGWR
jgi:hypothetical protein